MFTFLLVAALWFTGTMAYIDSKLNELDYRSSFVALVGLLLVVLSLALVKFL
jgi:hypothetical protein